MKRFYWRVAVIALTTAVCGLICIWVHSRAIAPVGAIPLVLFLPGAALVLALNPTRTATSTGERMLWAVAVSIAFSVFGGLVLNETTSLDRVSCVVLLCGLTGVSLLAALIRSDKHRVRRVPKAELLSPDEYLDSAADQDLEPSGDVTTNSHQRRASLGSALLLFAAIALVAGAVALSQHSVTTSNPKFIELWMTPTPAKAGASAHRAQLGVDNLTGVRIDIDVRLEEGTRGTTRIWNVSLPAGQTWVREVSRQDTEQLIATVSYASHPTTVVRYVDLSSPAS